MSSQGQSPKRSQVRRLSTRVAGVIGAAAFVAVGAAVLGVSVPFTTSSAESAGTATPPLNQVIPPQPGNLPAYVADQAAAVRLGKALFWDMQAGSDGKTACATCHFSAGTDSRTRNTLNPGKNAAGATPNPPFGVFGPNFQLTPANFPGLTGLQGDQVVGAQGVVPSTFGSISSNGAENTTPAHPDPVFNDGSGANEIQQISGTALGLTFDLTFSDGTPSTTGPIAAGADAAAIKAALDALPNIGSVTVTGGPLPATVSVAFDGPLVLRRNVPQLTTADGGIDIVTPPAQQGVLTNNLRRVTGRNTPTVINAVFNDRSFWDGRAQNDFNGLNPFGARDGTAAAATAVASGTVALSPTAVTAIGPLTDASLASQAVGPPGNAVEMSANGRTLRDIGKKLLKLKPLGGQAVAPNDSVLGPSVTPGQNGLSTPGGYVQMVKDAFQPTLWLSGNTITINPVSCQQPQGPAANAACATVNNTNVLPDNASLPNNTYTQMQYNWPLFWGLSIMAYEATLVSDQTPLDQFLAGDVNALTASQKAGFTLFWNTPKQTPPGVGCAGCHGPGPELTGASVASVGGIRAAIRSPRPCNDTGFFNIGVRPTLSDVGNFGSDPFGKSLSETELANPSPALCPLRQVSGSFKTPGLRNVGLTAPYFHNGGKATLEQVVEFYSRGAAPGFGFFNATETSAEIAPLLVGVVAINQTQKNQLVDFLRNGLTDPRVQKQSAPFDHPQLTVPNGHNGTADNDLVIGATGAGGTAAAFATFLGLPAPVPNPPVPPIVTPPGTTKFTFGLARFKTLKLRTVKTKGVVVSVTVPAGTAKIRIHFLRVTKKGQLLVASFDKVVKGRSGPIKILVPVKRLRRVAPGLYVVTTT